jgi:hypothetical protein
MDRVQKEEEEEREEERKIMSVRHIQSSEPCRTEIRDLF